MTEQEAKEVLYNHLAQYLKCDSKLNIYIGEILRQSDGYITFKAGLYYDGEEPDSRYYDWCVNKETGECTYPLLQGVL